MSQTQELLGQGQLGFQASPCVHSAEDVAWPRAIRASASYCEGSNPHNVPQVRGTRNPAEQDDTGRATCLTILD